MSPHRINRLCFEAQCADEAQAFQLRHNFAEVWQAQIAAAIDSACSQYDDGGATVYIERIEVDLGSITPEALQRDLLPLFQRQFAAELTKRLGASATAGKNKTPEYSASRALQHFLLYGRLPWWGEQLLPDNDALLLHVQTQAPAELQAFLYRHLHKRPLWQRLVWQFGVDAKRAIIALLPELRDVEEYIAAGMRQMSTAASPVASGEGLWGKLTDALLTHAPEIIASRSNGLKPNEALRLAIQHVLANAIAEPDAAIWHEAVAAGLSQSAANIASPDITGAPASHAAQPNTDNPTANGVTDGILTGIATPEGNTLQTAASAYPSHNATEPDAVRYVVRDAGLVLLAPFFAKFFAACGLLDGNAWRHKPAQHQALHLMKYLCNGEGKAAEHTLLLEKLCCGIALDEPVPRLAELSPEQLDEAEDLLQAVLGHWRALKNTSVNGLRETFLKRDGLLSQRDGVWHLQIERKTWDVLLDSVPWGYSTLSLPWNDYLIQVEW